jgi:hypothetical protein
MKNLIRNLLVACLLIVPILYVLQYLADKGLRNSKRIPFATWTDIYQSKINADVLIIGSSRAQFMVSPQILDSILGINTYNLGMNGWGTDMHLARFKIYLQHNKPPKFIIHSIDLKVFDKRADLWEYEQFLPYLDDSIIVNNTKQYEGRFTFPELYFPAFKYNKNLAIMYNGVKRNFANETKNYQYKGYLSNDLNWNYVDYESGVKVFPNGMLAEVRPDTRKRFIDYVSYCKRNNIKIIFEIAPIYYLGFLRFNNRNEIIKELGKIANEYDIPFLDYTDDTLCYNQKYFYNTMHLNKRGAEVFSKRLANDIKQYINPLK